MVNDAKGTGPLDKEQRGSPPASNDEPAGIYQVWHRNGEAFRHVANVEAGNYTAAVVLPLLKRGTPGTERVSWLVDDARPTGYGDKIVDPLGKAYRALQAGFRRTVLKETTMPVTGQPPRMEADCLEPSSNAQRRKRLLSCRSDRRQQSCVETAGPTTYAEECHQHLSGNGRGQPLPSRVECKP